MNPYKSTITEEELIEMANDKMGDVPYFDPNSALKSNKQNPDSILLGLLKKEQEALNKLNDKLIHVNPNCKDASRCNPHGETGEVTYKDQPINNRLDEILDELGIAYHNDYPDNKALKQAKQQILSLIQSASREARIDGLEKITNNDTLPTPTGTKFLVDAKTIFKRIKELGGKDK